MTSLWASVVFPDEWHSSLLVCGSPYLEAVSHHLLLCRHGAFSLCDFLCPRFPLLIGTPVPVFGLGSILNQSGLILTWLHLQKLHLLHIHRFWVHVNLEQMLFNPVKYRVGQKSSFGFFPWDVIERCKCVTSYKLFGQPSSYSVPGMCWVLSHHN